MPSFFEERPSRTRARKPPDEQTAYRVNCTPSPPGFERIATKCAELCSGKFAEVGRIGVRRRAKVATSRPLFALRGATGRYPLEGTRSVGGTTAGRRTPVETPSSGLVAPVANADGLNPLTISHTPMNSSHRPPGTVATAVDRLDRPSPTPYVLWTWRKVSPMMYATMTKGSDHGWPDGGRFALLAAPPKRGWRQLRKIGDPCAGRGTANSQPAPRSSRRRPPGKQHPGWDSRTRHRSFRFGSAHHEAATQPKLAWAVFRRSHPRGLV